MTRADRDALRELLARATPVPWAYREEQDAVCNWSMNPPRGFGLFHYNGEDVDAVVAMRNAIDGLLDALDAADEMRNVIGRQLREMEDDCWEGQFYREGKAAADAYDAKVKR